MDDEVKVLCHLESWVLCLVISLHGIIKSVCKLKRKVMSLSHLCWWVKTSVMGELWWKVSLQSRRTYPMDGFGLSYQSEWRVEVELWIMCLVLVLSLTSWRIEVRDGQALLFICKGCMLDGLTASNVCIWPVSLLNANDEVMQFWLSNCWTACPLSLKMLIICQLPFSLAKSFHIIMRQIRFIVIFIHQWVHSLFNVPRVLTFVKSTSCQCHYLIVSNRLMVSKVRESGKPISQDRHKPKHLLMWQYLTIC